MKFLQKGRYNKIKILDTPLILDTETAWNHDENEPKTWIVSIQVYFNGKTFLFRKPSEWIRYMSGLIRTYDLNNERRLIIFTHNQSFDLSFLLPYIQLYLPAKEDRHALLLDEHKIINYRQGGLDFRCSFLLTQKSLEKLGRDLNVEHQKKVGLYDYDKILFQDSTLSEDQKDYDIYDVLSLNDCICKQLVLHGDDLRSVPLTHTGYIRRKLRQSCRRDRYYRKNYFTKTKLDPEAYKFCVNAYSGGYTHNNRMRKDKIIIPEKYGMKYGKHRDFRSFYPTILRKYPLPWGTYSVYYDITSSADRLFHGDITVKEILDLSPKFSTITMLELKSAWLKDPEISMPFLQKSKCFFNDHENDFLMKIDNGRIIEIKNKEGQERTFETYVSGQLLRILSEQYHMEGTILKVYRFVNREIPACVAEVVDDLFKAKTDLKYKEKDCEKQFGQFAEETIDAHQNLMLSKSLLNAIYGCMAMNPVRPEFDIDYDQEFPVYISSGKFTDDEIAGALEDYYKGRNNFLPYQVGCFITEWAKYLLYEFMQVIGWKNVLYCDTDSIFYLSDDQIEKRVEKLNKEHEKTAPFVVDSKGNKIYYDVFEEEDDFLAFKGLHSKCYGIITEGKEGPELKATIAGIPAQTIIAMKKEKPVYLTREEELAGITKYKKLHNPKIKMDPWKALDRLNDQFVFTVNTGTTAMYYNEKPAIIDIDGHQIETAGGAIIRKLESKIIKNIDLCEEIEIEIERGNLS